MRRTLIFYSVLMFTLPLATFFGMENVLLPMLLDDGKSHVAFSGIAAVVVVNLVIAAYVIQAFSEDVGPPLTAQPKKVD